VELDNLRKVFYLIKRNLTSYSLSFQGTGYTGCLENRW
jgi:hypothetical protein